MTFLFQECSFVLYKQFLETNVFKYILSQCTTKPAKWHVRQRRLRLARVSAKSDPSLRCPHEETLRP